MTTKTTCHDIKKRFLTTAEAAAYLGFTQRMLENRRITGGGPRYVRISSRAVRYRLEDLEVWTTNRLKTSTSED